MHHPAGLHKGYHVGRWGQGWHHRLAVRRDVAPDSPRDRATYCRRDGATICDCKRHSRLHQPERWLPPRFLKKDLPSRDGDGRIRRASNLLLHNGGRLDKHYAIGYGLWGGRPLVDVSGVPGWESLRCQPPARFPHQECLLSGRAFHLPSANSYPGASQTCVDIFTLSLTSLSRPRKTRTDHGARSHGIRATDHPTCLMPHSTLREREQHGRGRHSSMDRVRTGAVCGPSQPTQQRAMTNSDADQQAVLPLVSVAFTVWTSALLGLPEDLVDLNDRASPGGQPPGQPATRTAGCRAGWAGCGIPRPPSRAAVRSGSARPTGCHMTPQHPRSSVITLSW